MTKGLIATIIEYNKIYLLVLAMTGATLEGKTLQIKDESEVKDILRDQSVKTLNTNNSNEFTKIHDNYLVSNGVNILDSDTSEIIRYDDGSFLIAQKNADNTLSPLVKIADKKLMEDFLTHVVQYELGANYRDAIVHITQLNEKREVSISYRKEIADLK
ncbi:hypothetical protein KKG31_04675 [Patescibacteria group bacterium]|nr:hypothetical protein [Patescibacteria group bacterium]MBU1758426.1 hypothetical protein [Patescibacteria group bacterium]